MKQRILPPIIPSLLLLTANPAPGTPAGLPPGWNFNAGDLIFASPAQAPNGALYVGSNDHRLYAISDEGEGLWSFETQDWIDSTPAVGEDGAIFFGSWDNHVYALEPDGELRWQYETGSAVNGSPVLVDGLVIVGSLDGFCYALDAATGEFVWAYLIDTEVQASPLYANGRVYFGGYDGTVHAVDAETGEGIWIADTESLPPLVKPTDLTRIYAAPVLASDGLILVGTGSGVLYAFDEFGSVIWYFEATAEIDSAPVIDAAGSIYFGCRDGLLYKISSLGFLEWTALVGRVYYSSPAIGRDGECYIVGDLSPGGAALFQLDEAGFTVDAVEWGANNDASPLLTSDGYLYVGMFDGLLYQFDPISPPAQSTWPQFQQGPARRASSARYWQPFRQWLSDWFGEEAAADPELAPGDGDSTPLLAEFALGLDPTAPDTPQSNIELVEGVPVASIWKYVGARDVVSRLEAGGQLDEIGQSETTPVAVSVDGDFELLQGTGDQPGGNVFMRFRFEEL